MTWARLDDGIYDHPKIIQAGRDARELFFASIVYSSRHLTDGVIPRGALRILQAWTEVDDPQAAAARLITVGLWDDGGDCYSIHDYLDYQPSREEVEEKREARAEAGRKGGMRSGEIRAQKAHAHHEANEANHEAIASAKSKQTRSKREANHEANHEANAKQNRTPSHPIPSHPQEEGFSSRKVISGIFAADVIEQGADAHSQPSADATETRDAATPAKRHAPVNPLWDALIEVFNYEPRSTGERSKWGKIVKHLKDAKATREDVLRAKSNYDAGVDRGVYRWSLTPNALDNHLGELLNGAPRAPTPSQPRGQPLGAAAAAVASRPIRTVDDAVPEGY